MKRWQIFRLVVFLLSMCNSVCAKQRMQTIVRLDEFGKCVNNEKYPVYYNTSGVHVTGKTSLGHATVTVIRTIKNFDLATATMNRCKDSADKVCELFQTWRFTSNVCYMLLMKNVIWTPLFTYKPQIACPLLKGFYTINNATLDVSKLALIKFPTDGYWRVTIEAFEGVAPVYCMFFAGNFAKVRV